MEAHQDFGGYGSLRDQLATTERAEEVPAYTSLDDLVTFDPRDLDGDERRHGQLKRRAWRGLLLGAMCAVVGVAALVARGTVTSHSRAGVTAGLNEADGGASAPSHVKGAGSMEKAAAVRPTFTAQRDGYEPLPDHTLRLYGEWDLVVEPNCEMVFRVDVPDEASIYTWNMSISDEVEQRLAAPREAGIEARPLITNGTEARAMFKGVNVFFKVHVIQQHPNGMTSDYYVNAVSKFVRREIRTLTPFHRERYFDAVEKVFTMDEAEGQALYGQHFLSHGHFTALHNSKQFGYHYGLQFLTSHPTLQIKFEKALSSVHPDIVFPYWDFMIDSAELGNDWTSSEVYQDNWFGSVDNGVSNNFRVRGRMNNISMIYDPDEVKFPHAFHSVYGFLGFEKEFNKAKWLQRTNHVCNFPAQEGFATCKSLQNCFGNYTSLFEFDMCLEMQVHANLHSMHAGLWNCAVDWQEFYEEYPWVTQDRLSFLANQVAATINVGGEPTAFRDYQICADSCDVLSDTYDTCKCTPSINVEGNAIEAVEDMDLVNDTMVLHYLQPFYELAHMGFQGHQFVSYDEDDDKYALIAGELEAWQVAKINRLVLSTGLFGGVQGIMASGAAPGDPLFWVMHQVFDKAAQALRLSNVYSGVNQTWNNLGNGLGGEGWNSMTPFTADIFEPMLGGNMDATDYLTNKQLWALLSPNGKDLAYVYDQFTSWGGCDFDPLEPAGGYASHAPTPSPGSQ